RCGGRRPRTCLRDRRLPRPTRRHATANRWTSTLGRDVSKVSRFGLRIAAHAPERSRELPATNVVRGCPDAEVPGLARPVRPRIAPRHEFAQTPPEAFAFRAPKGLLGPRRASILAGDASRARAPASCSYANLSILFRKN